MLLIKVKSDNEIKTKNFVYEIHQALEGSNEYYNLPYNTASNDEVDAYLQNNKPELFIISGDKNHDFIIVIGKDKGKNIEMEVLIDNITAKEITFFRVKREDD